jgi:HAD superfamily hydrolase (TIGR01450 family)
MFHPPKVALHQLIDRYDSLLLDAYGVLVHRDGALPGAVNLVETLNRIGKPYFLVSNTAAHLPEHAAERYRRFGFNVAPESILTAGLLIKPYFEAEGLAGKRCVVLGPPDSHRYAETAGARVVSPGEDFDIVLIGDQVGFPFLETVDVVLSQLIAKLDRGEPVRLILPNPDLIFPKATGFGITSGMVALIFESALKQRFPGRSDTAFVHLGKPERGLFELAASRAGSTNLVMIGDQIDTDILGANRFGIDSALVTTGVTGRGFAASRSGARPTYLFECDEDMLAS